MSIDSLALLSLYGGTADATSSLLATLYGQGGTRRPSGLTPYQALSAAEKNQTRDVALTARKPEIKRAIDAFTQAVGKATSVDELLRDKAVMEVVLTANGLSDQIKSPALARKALSSDLSDPTSLANTLTDTRWKQTTATFDFAGKGLSVIQDPAVISKLADGYAEVKWRQSLDAGTPGLSNALTFRANAASVGSVDEILADPVLREVVTVALKIPKEIAFQTLTAQENAVTTRLDLSKLKDPKFVESFAQRYLYEASQAVSTNSSADLMTLAIKASGLVI